MAGIPGMAGTEHVGFTVPDIEAATRFFVEVIGCRQIFDAGPFQADDDWMAVHLGVDPRAVIRKLRMLRCGNGPAFELFQYEAPDQKTERPRNSDHAGHHLAFYVADIDAAYAYLKDKGVTTMGAPSEITSGPSAGLRWLYFLAPWGMQLELVSYPQGMAYEKTTTDRLWSPL
ncbi:MAG: VOC family protein [Rhizobiaceae bacterium]|nr:VOC family protein [Rhizobiaceae bacterium]